MKETLYCPVCRSERKIAKFDSRMSFLLTSLCFSILGILVHWVWFVFGITTLTFGELLFRITNRAITACPKCDFDPYLYARDIPSARRAVEKKIQIYKLKHAAKNSTSEEGITQDGKESLAKNSKSNRTTKLSSSPVSSDANL